jgi:hypothetical protein
MTARFVMTAAIILMSPQESLLRALRRTVLS